MRLGKDRRLWPILCDQKSRFGSPRQLKSETRPFFAQWTFRAMPSHWRLFTWLAVNEVKGVLV
jgi:hypothetical protein